MKKKEKRQLFSDSYFCNEIKGAFAVENCAILSLKLSEVFVGVFHSSFSFIPLIKCIPYCSHSEELLSIICIPLCGVRNR